MMSFGSRLGVSNERKTTGSLVFLYMLCGVNWASIRRGRRVVELYCVGNAPDCGGISTDM
jgi:hypothetical protein